MASVNLEAAVVPITIEQGKTVVIPFAATRNALPMDLTGYEVRLQVRETFSSAGTLLSCTTANGKVSWVNQAQGQYQLVLAPSDTTAIPASKFSEDTLDAVYDCELVSSVGDVYPASKGTFTIKREVTRG